MNDIRSLYATMKAELTAPPYEPHSVSPSKTVDIRYARKHHAAAPPSHSYFALAPSRTARLLQDSRVCSFLLNVFSLSLMPAACPAGRSDRALESEEADDDGRISAPVVQVERVEDVRDGVGRAPAVPRLPACPTRTRPADAEPRQARQQQVGTASTGAPHAACRLQRRSPLTAGMQLTRIIRPRTHRRPRIAA